MSPDGSIIYRNRKAVLQNRLVCDYGAICALHVAYIQAFAVNTADVPSSFRERMPGPVSRIVWRRYNSAVFRKVRQFSWSPKEMPLLHIPSRQRVGLEVSPRQSAYQRLRRCGLLSSYTSVLREFC